jgi:hypothetical protein
MRALPYLKTFRSYPSRAIPSWPMNCTMILVWCAAPDLLAFIEQQKAGGS